MVSDRMVTVPPQLAQEWEDSEAPPFGGAESGSANKQDDAEADKHADAPGVADGIAGVADGITGVADGIW